MEVYLLGAGRPAQGKKPSALKKIAPDTKAMDWQIRSFKSIASHRNIHYLGGYNVEDVIQNYPQINYIVIPDWETKGIVHTLLKAPFAGVPVLTAYSDTIFREELLKEMLQLDADIVYGIDSLWKERYEFRSEDDIQSAETLQVDNNRRNSETVEFTGLIHFSSKAIKGLSKLDESTLGNNLIEVIQFLKQQGLSTKHFDVSGHWAEFNSPRDIARFILGTKAETLSRLEPVVSNSYIGKQVSFTVEHWQRDSNKILGQISKLFHKTLLVIRSSSKGEDNWYSSNAGGFKSLLNIDSGDEKAVKTAIDAVINSYGEVQSGKDQVLVQKFIDNVKLAGVVFTCTLESGAPYYHFNFDDKTTSTESVTAGTHDDLRVVILSRFGTEKLEQTAPELVPVLEAIQELEKLLGFDKLDIEFAVDNKGLVHIFQARPITVDHSDFEVDFITLEDRLKKARKYFSSRQNGSPNVFGDKTLFGNMPDWNPAEIIGTRPKTLAFSLYRYLITNEIWAQQRAEFGYQDVRPSPLIASYCGQPYVDTRASLNSFIPANLPDETRNRLANAYLNIFRDNPLFHDKIEFEIAFTIWTPQFAETAKTRLIPYGVTTNDLLCLEKELKIITRQALTRLGTDTASIEQLNQRRKPIIESALPTISKFNALISDCKNFGTLAFSHAARAGFVATTLLNGLVESNVLSKERRAAYLRSINTVASELEIDKHTVSTGSSSIGKLVKKYGHLRPGTYEITTSAYWEDVEQYLVSDDDTEPINEPEFIFSDWESKKLEELIKELGADLSVVEFDHYLSEAIRAREQVKFEFTKNLSKALDLCTEYGKEVGISRRDLSYLDFYDLEKISLNATTVEHLHSQIKTNKQQHLLSRLVELPSLISNEADFYCFERLNSLPNFVTLQKIDAVPLELISNEKESLKNKLVLIPQADPGYDWLFGHGIKGLITLYGGANSHMAIRAAEIGLPAAIGVGENLFKRISKMKRVELDCENQTIRAIQ